MLGGFRVVLDCVGQVKAFRGRPVDLRVVAFLCTSSCLVDLMAWWHLSCQDERDSREWLTAFSLQCVLIVWYLGRLSVDALHDRATCWPDLILRMT